jgi:hypothetical protein
MPAAEGEGHPDIGGRGDGGDGDEHPDERIGARFCQGHHADDPGQDRDHDREDIRGVDEVRDGPDGNQKQLGCVARRPYGHSEGEGDRDRGEEPQNQGKQALTHPAAVPLADPERHGDDRVVFGADHHRAHDEDLRVGQDAYGADQPGDGQQDEEARGIHRAPSDGGFHHFPHGSDLPVGRTDPPARASGGSEGSVHLLHGDRVIAIKTEIAQRPEHGVSCAVVHVEKDRVAVWPMGGPLEHDQVPDAGQHREPGEQRPGDARRAHDADVQHHEPARTDSRRIMVSPLCSTGVLAVVTGISLPSARTRKSRSVPTGSSPSAGRLVIRAPAT